MKHLLPAMMVENAITIHVAGCGGNGSQILAGLPRLHTAMRALGHPGLKVTAFDPDIITEANVGRQLFSPADIGCSKAHVLINRINLYYGLRWKAVHDRLNGYDHNWPDMLIGCVDTIKARQSLAGHKSRYKYWLDLGNTDKKGQVILGEMQEPPKNEAPTGGDLMKGKKKGQPLPAAERKVRLPHVMDLHPELKKKNPKEDNTPSCSLAEALDKQDLFINQMVATCALQLLWQFFRQGGLNLHGYYINLETGRVTPIPIK